MAISPVMSTIRTPLRPGPSTGHAIRNRSEPILQERFRELNAASSRDAAALAARGTRAGLWGLLFAPLYTFLHSYVRGGEWRRGVAGLVAALFVAYEVFVRYAKLWELHHSSPPTPPPKEGVGG